MKYELIHAATGRTVQTKTMSRAQALAANLKQSAYVWVPANQ